MIFFVNIQIKMLTSSSNLKVSNVKNSDEVLKLTV